MTVPLIVVVAPILILCFAAFGVATGFALGWGQEYAMQRLRRAFVERQEGCPWREASVWGKAFLAGEVEANTYFADYDRERDR